MAKVDFSLAYADMMKRYPALQGLFKEANKSKTPETEVIVYEIRTTREKKGEHWIPVASETRELTVNQFIHIISELDRAKDSGVDMTLVMHDTRFGSLPYCYTTHRAEGQLRRYTWDFVYKPARLTYKALCLKCRAINTAAHRQEGTIGTYKIVCNEYDKYAVAWIKNLYGDSDILTDWLTLAKCKEALEDLSTR